MKKVYPIILDACRDCPDRKQCCRSFDDVVRCKRVGESLAKKRKAERERIVKFLILSKANLLDVKKIADGSYEQALKATEGKWKEREMGSNLKERRAEFVYNGARLAAIAAKAPIVPVLWAEREESFKKQFLDVIERQCGYQRSTSPEELHGSWMQAYLEMGWIEGEPYDREKRVHPDLVPYALLGQLERDKDAVFVALCEIARQFIYDLATEGKEG